MQCRNALRQHAPGRVRPRLTQTETDDQCIWTSDAILAEAFARFVQVSKARRRYESRVPGPLEFRRRHAKRQYGLTNVSAGSSVNPALFGDYSMLDNTGIYKWQAPIPHAKLKNVKAARDESVSWWPSWLDDLSQKDDLDLSNEYQQGSQKKDSTLKEEEGGASALLSENDHGEKPASITETSETISKLSENEASLREAQTTTSDINIIPQTEEDTKTNALAISTDDKVMKARHPQLDALFDNLKHVHHIDMLALQDILAFMCSTEDHARLESCKRLITDYLPTRSINEDAFEALCNTVATKWEKSTVYARNVDFILKNLHQVVDYRTNPRLHDIILRLCERIAYNLRTVTIHPRYYKKIRSAVHFAAEPREQSGSINVESILSACKIFKLLARVPEFRHHDPTLASSMARLLAKIPYDGSEMKVYNKSDKERIISAFTSVIDESVNHTLLPAVVRHFMAHDAAIIRGFVVDGESTMRDKYCDSTLARINLWLRCAHNSRALKESHRDSQHSWAVYQEIAQYFEPGELRQLNWLSNQHLALALLAGWCVNDAATQVQQMDGQQSESPRTSDPELTLANFSTLHSRLDWTLLPLFKKTLQRYSDRDTEAIPHLLRGLLKVDKDYKTIISRIVEARSWSAILRYRIFERIILYQDLTIPENLTISMMEQLTELKHYHLALSLVSSLTIDSLPKLSDFIKTLSTIQDFHMIIRTLDEVLLRNKRDERLIKGFVEQLALAIAEHNTLNQQQAFRRVWVCHCFTHAMQKAWPSCGQDPGSHIARALVQTAVIQRIQQGIYLSKDRIATVIEKIRELEGEETATDLDQVLFVLQKTLVQKQWDADLPRESEEYKHFVPTFAEKLTVEDFLAPRGEHERSAVDFGAGLESMSPEADIRSGTEVAARSEEITSYRPVIQDNVQLERPVIQNIVQPEERSMIRDILQLEELSDFDLIEPKHTDGLPSRQ